MVARKKKIWNEREEKVWWQRRIQCKKDLSKISRCVVWFFSCLFLNIFLLFSNFLPYRAPWWMRRECVTLNDVRVLGFSGLFVGFSHRLNMSKKKNFILQREKTLLKHYAKNEDTIGNLSISLHHHLHWIITIDFFNFLHSS